MGKFEEELKQIIDEWVFSLGEMYDNASERNKKHLEEAVPDEYWDTLIDKIKLAFFNNTVTLPPTTDTTLLEGVEK